MPGESSEVTEQNVYTDSVSPQTQDEPPLSVSSEQPVSISPNELTNGVKRPLPKDSVDSDEIKKMRLTKNVNEKELGVSSLNSKNDNEGNHIDIGKNLDQITENNSDEHSCVSNKTNNGENDITSNHFDDKAQNIDDVIDKNKNTDVGGIDSENESSKTNNVNNNCGPTISKITVNGIKSVNTIENGIVQDDQISNDDSSQLKASSENVDNEGDVDKISLPTKTLAVDENCLLTKPSEIRGGDVQLSSASNTHQSVTESTNETVNDHNNYTTEVVDNNDDDDCVFIESHNNFDVDDDAMLIDMTLKNPKKHCKRNFLAFLKLFSQDNLNFDKFESYFLQMMTSQMTTINEAGKLRYKLQLLAAREKQWHANYLFVVKQLKELTAIIKLHASEVKENAGSKPHVITRTVGLQASMADPKKNNAVRVSKPIPSSQQFNNEPVDITSDGDDGDNGNNGNNGDNDIISIDSLEYTEPLNSNCIENKTKKKRQLPSSGTTSSPAKDVPPTTSLLDVNNSPTTIDLTGPDDLNNSQTKLNVERSPIKIIQRASHIGSSPQLTKGVTFIELPHIPPSSSAIIVRTSSTGSTPLTTSTVASLSTSNVTKTPVRPFVYKDGKLLPVQLSPVAVQRKIQPSPITSRQSLQPVPPSIPIVLKHPAPLPALVLNYKSNPEWKNIPPAPVISISQSTNMRNPKELVLSWNIATNNTIAEICSFQIFSYQEMSSEAPRTDRWRKIGDVAALPLPMSCSLTKYMTGEKYYFAVRAIDKYKRAGPFSQLQSISS